MLGKLFRKQESRRADSSSRRIEVGWLLKDETAGVIWDTPRPVRWDFAKPTTSKSAQVCPAVIQFDRLHYVINSPVDLHPDIARARNW